jgi:hypothetical protein
MAKKKSTARGVAYVVSSRGKKVLSEVSGYGRLILRALLKAGERLTVAQIAKKVRKDVNVIGVYVWRLKRYGFLVTRVAA